MKIIIKENNTQKVLSEMKRKKKLCLLAIGEKARSIWVKEITRMKIVDTGRFRGSADYKTIGEDEVAIGSNVEYAPYLELGTSRQKARPSLRTAILNHKKTYKQIVEAIMKN